MRARAFAFAVMLASVPSFVAAQGHECWRHSPASGWVPCSSRDTYDRYDRLDNYDRIDAARIRAEASRAAAAARAGARVAANAARVEATALSRAFTRERDRE